jgi:hypothetical protein
MRVLVAASLLLIAVLALMYGLLSVFRDLVERIGTVEPVFRDSAANQQARSQFAWQSRSHFREPD